MAHGRDMKKVNIHHILEKCQSKHELYSFLTQDC
jgi:hypothetical protein